MKPFVVILCTIVLAAVFTHETRAEPTPGSQTNWTFTYIKARDAQAAGLREFIEANWFAMDAVAVERGLFRSYRLIENLGSGEEGEPEWDFIVAVEYFGDQGYSDIAQEFEAIRSAHTTVLVDGLGFRELGSIVRSERLRFLD